MSAGLHTSQNT